MQGIQLVLTPFVWILMLFYNFFENYGIALILFAFLVKLILFPFSLKGKRSMIQMNMMQGKMQKLQKMYGNNKEKYNLEVQKLYEKEKVNPMGGCLWSFLPLLVLLPLYAIIRQPLTYMMNLSPDVISQVASALNWETVAMNMGWIKESAAYANMGYNQLYLASLITPENVATVQAAVGDAAKGLFAVNFSFLGLDLSQIPQLKFWVAGGLGLFLLPVVSAVSGFLFSMISMKTNAVNQQSAQAANNPSSKMMLLMSPLMSLWIGFSMPAALCIYWIAQNLLSMVQEFVASRMLKKDYQKAAEEAARREAEEKEEERRQKEEERLERARRIEEAKLNKGKKKPAKKKDPEDDRIPASVKEASRVGIRAYARGRNYDPYRYSQEGPTPYEAPTDRQTEESALARDFEKESDEIGQTALEMAADDMIVEELLEEQAGEAGEEARGFETPAYDAPDYDAPDYDGESGDENKD